MEDPNDPRDAEETTVTYEVGNALPAAHAVLNVGIGVAVPRNLRKKNDDDDDDDDDDETTKPPFNCTQAFCKMSARCSKHSPFQFAYFAIRTRRARTSQRTTPVAYMSDSMSSSSVLLAA